MGWRNAERRKTLKALRRPYCRFAYEILLCAPISPNELGESWMHLSQLASAKISAAEPYSLANCTRPMGDAINASIPTRDVTMPESEDVTELTTKVKLGDLKKLARRVTTEEQIECGFATLEAVGLDQEQIEGTAQGIGLDGESFAYSIATPPFRCGTEQFHDTKRGSHSSAKKIERSPWCDVESVVDHAEVVPDSDGHLPQDEATNTLVHERIASALETLANHFDPPPPNIVDTGYVAGRLGCTREYVSQMAKSGAIPSTV